MSGGAGFPDDFHQRVLFNLFNSSLNEDHVSDTPASSQHLQVKRNATPSDDNDYLLKSRKLRSRVWNDFRRVKLDGKKKAICDHCNKEFVGESKKGTSHLLSHLKICPEKRRKKEDGNKPSENGNLTAHVVVGKKSMADLELSSLDLARSAIKRGWKTFTDDLLHVYRNEKQKLCESFTKLSCRFSLTVDMVNHYGFITVYYIDENWEMKRNILFLQDKWPWVSNLEKLRVFNLDESLCFIVWPNYDVRVHWGDIPSGVPFGDNFKGFVSLPGYIDYLVEKKEGYIDIVSRATKVGSVSDIIKNMLGYDLIEKVDKALRYVQSVLYDNDKHDLFTEIRVSLRGKKRDQSSFTMMMCALEYKQAFLSLRHIDYAFKSVSLTENEWDIVTVACDCLEVLNDVACSLSSNKYRTANSCIHLILNMYKELLRLGSNNSNPCSYTKEIAFRIRNNFIEGYWQGNSLVISIVAFFDPCYKMKLVRDWYNIIYPEEVEVHISRFVDDLRRIYNFYANVPDNPTSSIPITSDALFGISELDRYLREKLPLDENFEILAWWRNSTPHFPTLARMARDFLAAPICEMNSETKDDIMKMHDDYCSDAGLAFGWTKFWLQYSHHEVQILENPPSYHWQEITKTRQGNASSSCVNYEMVSHKQTLKYWSNVWNECNLNIPSSYRRNILYRGDYPDTMFERFLEEQQNLETEEKWKKPLKNLGPFRRSDLTTLVDTKKKFKVDCELDGSDLARMTSKLGHSAVVDNLLRVYKEEKQRAVKYLNELSCHISLEVSNPHIAGGSCKIVTVQFIDEVWKLQRKILCLDLKGNGDCVGISPQELKAGRSLCSIVHVDALKEIDDEGLRRTKHPIHGPFLRPFSTHFQGIQSFSDYIGEFITVEGAKSVSHKMKKILGCGIFEKIKHCYRYVREKYNGNFGKNRSMPNEYDHQSWEIALEVRETFLELQDKDHNFKSISLENKEWDALIAGYNCLEVFKDVISEHLSGKEYITANVCLPLICDIYESMQRKGSNNYYIRAIIEHLKKTFVKDYWDGNGLALAIAAVLDPRFKMDVVEKWYNLIYGKEAEGRIQGFKEELRRCYNYYGDGFELDNYLRAPKCSIYYDSGILTWWRDSTSQFPTLARMARDILAIPVWSDNSAMIDEIQTMCYRLQDLDIVNAFVCTPSWLKSLKDK